MEGSDDDEFDVKLNPEDRVDERVGRAKRSSTPRMAIKTSMKPWTKHYQACLSRSRSLRCTLSQMQVSSSPSSSSWESAAWTAKEVAVVYLDDNQARGGKIRSRIDCPWVVVRGRRPFSSPLKWISSSPRARDDASTGASSEAAASVLGPMFQRYHGRRLESTRKDTPSARTSSSQWSWGFSTVTRGFQSVLAMMDLVDSPRDYYDCTTERKQEYDDDDDAAQLSDSTILDEDDADDALYEEDVYLAPTENIVSSQLVMESCQLILDQVSRQQQRKRHIGDNDGDEYRWIERGEVLLLSLEQGRDQDGSASLDTFRDLCRAASTDTSPEECNDEDIVRQLLGHLNDDDVQLLLETLVAASGEDFFCAKVSEDVVAISLTKQDEDEAQVDTVDVSLFQLHGTRRRLEKRLESLAAMVDDATRSALSLNKKKVKGPALLYQLKRRKLASEAQDQCANSLLAVDQTLLTIESRRHDGALLECWQSDVIPTMQALRREQEEESAVLEEWNEEIHLQRFLGDPSYEEDLDASAMFEEWQQEGEGEEEDDEEPFVRRQGRPEKEQKDANQRWDGLRSHSWSPANSSLTQESSEQNDVFHDVPSITGPVPRSTKGTGTFHAVPSILDTAPTLSSDAEDSFEDAVAAL